MIAGAAIWEVGGCRGCPKKRQGDLVSHIPGWKNGRPHLTPEAAPDENKEIPDHGWRVPVTRADVLIHFITSDKVDGLDVYLVSFSFSRYIHL